MKKIAIQRALQNIFLSVVFYMGAAAQAPQRNQLFDDNWLFFRGAVLGGEKEDCKDAGWRKIDLPHDWSIEDIPNTNSPFSSGAVSQVNGGFTEGGTGWYRKHFTIPATDAGKRFVFQFDGVYMNSDVWVNGKRLGNHPYGYTSFYYDATEFVKPGQANFIAVRVRNEGENSRWYSGSGIYRHVWLQTLPPTHIAQWGTYITTPQVSTSVATVEVKTKILALGGTGIRLVSKILDATGNAVTSLEETKTIDSSKPEMAQTFTINQPQLWSVDKPILYKLVTELYVANKLVDAKTSTFGIRSISFDAVNGFRLNGVSMKLKGGCVHHDNGPLGAKAYDRAEERKVEILKAAGYNAIRTSHNPPSPTFLDACDRLGMLVIDEAFDAWATKKNPQDYSVYFKEWWQRDLESMVLRDRNHPSIIMWSTGNEIPNRDKPEVVAVSQKLSDFIQNLDSTRPVTCGVNGIEANKDPILATLGVSGYNYALDKYESEHIRKPERVVYASESFASDVYNYWQGVLNHPWVIGDFVWTAWDYIGEASIGWLGYPQRQYFYPWNLAFCGDIDVCGWKRPQSYYRDALWKTDQLSLFVKPPKPSFDTATFTKETWAHWDYTDLVAHWNFKGYEKQPLAVEVNSTYDEVELFLNKVSLGKKPTGKTNKYKTVYQVLYAAGTLEVVGYAAGKKMKTAVLQTASAPAKLKIVADRQVLTADGQDLSYITVEVTDTKGIVVPNAENLLKFQLVGNATIVGVGNANPISVESCTQPQRKTWRGRCLIIVKAGKIKGPITLKASTNNLPGAQLTIQSK